MPTTTTDWLLAYLSSLQRDDLFAAAQATPPLPLTKSPQSTIQATRADPNNSITIHEAATVRTIVITGLAGSGKTTTIRQLAADAALVCQAALRRGLSREHVPPAPIYLDLARFAGTLEATLADQIGLAAPALADLANRCDLLFLLDGLDRIPASIQLTSLASIQRSLQALGDQVRWVASCRSEALDLFQPWMGNATLFTLGALTTERVIDVIGQHTSPAIATWLQTQPELLELACRPRWLAALLHSKRMLKLPVARGALLQELLTSVLAETAPAQALANSAWAALPDLANALDQRPVPLSSMEAEASLHTIGDPAAVLRVLIAAGILSEDSQRRIQFAQPLLLHTARAAGLVRIDLERWDTHVLSKPWHEALVLAYGLHPTPTLLLDWMLRHEAADAIARALIDTVAPEQYDRLLAVHVAISPALRIRLADGFRAMGATAAAISQLQQAEQQGYNETGLFRRLGDLHAQESDWQAARLAYIQVLEHEPHDLRYRHRLGAICGRLGASNEAESALQGVLSAVQQLRGDAAAELGQLYSQQSRYELALAAYQQAVQAQPGSTGYQRGMAHTLYQLGRHAAAEEILRDVLAANPDDGLAHADLGRIYAITDRLKLALDCTARAATLRPQDASIATFLGQLRMQHGDPTGARMALQHAAELTPNDPALQIALGQACSAAGSTQAALSAYRSAVQLDPTNPTHLRLLGSLLAEQGHYAEATSVLQQAHAIQPNDPTLLAALGSLMQRKGDSTTALTLYRQALSIAPNTPDYALAVGLLLLESGQHTEAIRHLARALDLAPQRADLHAAIARYAAERKQWAAAAESFLHAAHHEPSEPAYPREAGICLIEAGNPTKGRSLLARAVRCNRNNSETWLAIGNFYANAGQYPRAIRNLKRAGQSSAALELLGRCFYATNRRDEAITTFGQALVAGSPGPQTLEYYSRSLGESGQIARAYDVAQRAIAIGGEQPSVLQLAGSLARQLGRPHEALALLDRALACDPNHAAAHAERGLVHLAQGQPQTALEAARTALRAEPKSPVATLTAGLALMQLGRRDQAQELIEQAVAEEPTNAAAHAARRDLLFYSDPSTALAAAKRASELAPAEPAHLLRMGELLLSQADLPAAIRAFEATLTLDRRHAESYAWLSRAYAQARTWDTARSTAEQALALAPANAEYRALLAEAHAGAGDMRTAIDLLQEAIASSGERTEWLHGLGSILVRYGQTAQGIEQLRRATLANPHYAPAQHDLGLALAETGELTSAVQSLGKAIQLAPEQIEWHADLAEMQINRGWYAEAIAELETGLALAPGHTRLLRLRAEARIRTGRAEDAQSDLVAALRRNPDDLPTLTLYTQLALQRAQPKSALGAARRAVTLQPEDPQHHRQLATVLRALGKHNEAAEQLEQIVTSTQDTQDYATLAEDYAASGNAVRARWAWEQAFSRTSNQPELQVRYAAFLLTQGDLQGTRREIEHAVAQQPDSPTILTRYAELLLLATHPTPNSNDTAAAMQAAREAAALVPEDMQAWRVLGVALWRHDQPEEALASIQRAHSLARQDATTAALLGMVALDLKQYDQAIAAFEHALQIEPGMAIAQAGLARALRMPIGDPLDIEELQTKQVPSVPIDRALAAIEAALAIQPQHPAWHFERGIILQLAGRYADAASEFEAITNLSVAEIRPASSWADLVAQEIERVPHATDVLVHCAVCYEMLGQIDQAAVALDSVLAELPNFAPAIELRGLIAARRNELDLAHTLLSAVLELAPAAQRALVALGQVLVALGRAAEALGLLERASDQHPGDAALSAQLSDAYLAAGKRDRALQASTKAARLEPRNADYHQRLASLYAEAGRLQEARAELMSATTLQPRNADWHVQMADICLGLGMREAARGAFRKAAEIAPDQPHYRYELARFLADQGEEIEARTTLEEVVATAPERGEWRHELGRLYTHLGDQGAAVNQFAAAVEHMPDEPRHWLALATAQQPVLGANYAIETLERALTIFPQHSELHTALGSLYEEQAPDTALWHYRRAVAQQPEQAEPWWRYGRALFVSGERQDAVAAIDRALTIDPRAAAAHAVKSQLLAAGGDFQGALHHGRTAAAIGPQDTTSVAWVATALQKARRYDEALTVLSKAIDRNPEDADLLAQSGEAAIAAGRFNQAIELYDRALKLRPQDATIYYQAGVAHKNMKNYPAAIRLLRRAIQLRPSYGDAIRELSRLGPLAFISTYVNPDRPAEPPDSAPHIDDLPPFERPDRRS